MAAIVMTSPCQSRRRRYTCGTVRLEIGPDLACRRPQQNCFETISVPTLACVTQYYCTVVGTGRYISQKNLRCWLGWSGNGVGVGLGFLLRDLGTGGALPPTMACGSKLQPHRSSVTTLRQRPPPRLCNSSPQPHASPWIFVCPNLTITSEPIAPIYPLSRHHGQRQLAHHQH